MTTNLWKWRIVLSGLALLGSAGAATGAPRDEFVAPVSTPTKLELRDVSSSADSEGKIVVYKVILPGGAAYKNEYVDRNWAIFEVVGGQTVRAKQSSYLIRFPGFARWADHDVIAIRACKKNKTGWDDLSSCLLGNGNVVKLPEGESIFDYIFEFKWEENGVQVGKTAILKSQ
jgi:hypothetical protein